MPPEATAPREQISLHSSMDFRFGIGDILFLTALMGSLKYTDLQFNSFIAGAPSMICIVRAETGRLAEKIFW